MSSTAATNQSAGLPPEAPIQPSAPQGSSELELRQVAGLTAGDSMSLPPGSYDFGAGNSSAVGFSLEIGIDASVMVLPGVGGVQLDSEIVSEPRPLHQQTINVGSARFRVGTPRPQKRHRDEIVAGSAPQIHEPAISVIDSIHGHHLDSREQASRLAWQLAQARLDLALQRRTQHADPEEVLYRARVGPGLCWHRRSDHWHFGQVSIATADLPWQPRLHPASNTAAYQSSYDGDLRALSTLPSVPVLADLRVGPLAIVGSRAARLACARHIMTSLATQSSPEFIALTVLAEGADTDDWEWARALPHTHTATESAFPVLIIDGLAQLQDNNFGLALAEPGGVGVVLLADDVQALPPTCATVVCVSQSGTATVVNHRDGWSATDATPHGISVGKANTAAMQTAAFSR